MANTRVKDLPVVTAPVAGDKILIDGLTTRVITIEDFAEAFSITSGVRQTYSATTTDADPGAGIFQLNNATPASATAAYLDNLDVYGATVSGVFDTYDDSTNTTKGILRFEKATDNAVWAQFNVTGSVVDGTGYRKVTLASGTGSGAFTAADEFAITFYRSGDAGGGISASTANAFTAQQYFTLATITDAANLAWTVSSGQKAKVTLGGNRTMNAVTGAVEGATYSLWVIQDGTGSRTISWTTSGAGSFDFGTVGAPTLTTTLNKADLLTFEAVTIAGTLKLRFSGIARGFA